MSVANPRKNPNRIPQEELLEPELAGDAEQLDHDVEDRAGREARGTR